MAGNGASPISDWLTSNALYEKHIWADDDQTLVTIAENLFFGPLGGGNGPIFADGFESGNFSAWTDTVGSPTVETTYKHHGNYSMRCTPAAYGQVCAYKSGLSATAIMYQRAYVYFAAGLPTSDGQEIDFSGIGFNSSSNAIFVNVLRTGGNIYWGTTTYIAGDYTMNYEASPSNPQLGTWYCVELVRDVTNGRSKLYVDGVLKVDVAKAHSGNSNMAWAGVNYVSYAGLDTYNDCIVVADAYIGLELQTFTKSFSFDGLLQKTITKTVSFDGLLQKTLTKTLSFDGLLTLQTTKDFTFDGLLQKTITESFSFDGLLSGTLTKDFSFDALLQGALTKAFTFDALSQKTFTKDFSYDALLQKTLTKDFSFDALLQKTLTKDFSFDALLAAAYVQFTFDGLLESIITPPPPPTPITGDYFKRPKPRPRIDPELLELIQQYLELKLS